MKLTKQDLMRLPKERLAELIVELTQSPVEPPLPIMPTTPVAPLMCDGTHCTNPHMDCINCPNKTSIVYTETKSNKKYYGD